MSLGTGFFNSCKYDSVRSSYSPSVLKEVQKLFAEKKQLALAEVGAGSGKFTDIILNAGLNIKELNIIEPDKKGIELHREKFEGETKYPILYYNSTSDKTNLANNSVDAILIAHAFHWFDLEQTRFEFQRILKNMVWFLF